MDLYTKTGVAEIHYRNWLDFVTEIGRNSLPKLADFYYRDWLDFVPEIGDKNWQSGGKRRTCNVVG